MKDDIKKSFEQLLKKKWFGNAVALCIAVVFYLALSHINYLFRGFGVFFGYIAPIIYGIVIACVMNPVANLFEDRVYKKMKKEGLRHNLSVTTALVLVLAFIALIISALIPSLVNSITTITNSMDDYYSSLESFAEDNAVFFEQLNIDIVGRTNSWETLLSNVMGFLSENTQTLAKASQDIGKNAGNFVLGFILAIYFLLAKKSLIAGMNKLRKLLLSEKTFTDHNNFFERCYKIIIQYICFDIVDAIIVGIINAVFMMILKMPSVALISVIIGVTNLVPTFGPIVGGLIAIVILLITNPVDALIFLIFTLILQTFDGYILKPRMFGKTLGLPAVWVLVSIIVGGKIFGIIGIILAIPVAAIISFAYEENFIPMLEKRKEDREKEV